MLKFILLFSFLTELTIGQTLQFSYKPLQPQDSFLLTSRQEIKLQGLLKKESTPTGWIQKNIKNMQWASTVRETQTDSISQLETHCLYHQVENHHSLGSIAPEEKLEGNKYLLSFSKSGEMTLKNKETFLNIQNQTIRTLFQCFGNKNELVPFLLSRSWTIGEKSELPATAVLSFVEINSVEAITNASLLCLQEESFDGQKSLRFQVFIEASQQKGNTSLDALFQGEIVVALETTQLLFHQINGDLKITDLNGSTQGETFSSRRLEFFTLPKSSTQKTLVTHAVTRPVAFSISQYDPEDSFGTAGFLDKYGGTFCKIILSHPDYSFYAYQGIQGKLLFQDNLQKNLLTAGAQKLAAWKQKHPNTFGNFLTLEEGLQTEEIRFFPNGSCLLPFYSRALPSDTANTLQIKGTLLLATGDTAGKITKIAPFLQSGTFFLIGEKPVKWVTNRYTYKKDELTGEEIEVPEYKMETSLWISSATLYDTNHQILVTATRSPSDTALLIEIPPHLQVALLEVEYKEPKILEVPFDVYFGAGLGNFR